MVGPFAILEIVLFIDDFSAQYKYPRYLQILLLVILLYKHDSQVHTCVAKSPTFRMIYNTYMFYLQGRKY